MLPHLFALVLHIHSLYVSIGKLSYNSNLKEAFNNLSPLIHLINFHLCSIDLFWNLDEISQILRQMPSLQPLTLNLCTEDEDFVEQENFAMILPPSLKQIHFFIRYHFHEPVFDVKYLTASCSVVFPISCLLDETNKRVLMFTDSFGLRLLDLPATVGKQMLRGCKCMQQVENLCVFDSTSLADILLTVQHFQYLRKLCIKVKGIGETCKCFLSITRTYFDSSRSFLGMKS
jgi:hypothetical protein